MNFKHILYILGLLGLFNCSTSKKIEALKPEPSKSTPSAIESKNSMLSVPLTISLKEIENQVNKNLKGLIFNDSILEDDKTEMKIWKFSEIKLSEKENNIASEIPLKIWIKHKIGTDFLGLNTVREFNLNGTIFLNSVVQFNNFKLTTSSIIESIKWNESPSVLIAGKDVPITYLVNPSLSSFKTKIAQKIDEAINKNCDFKENLYALLHNLSMPFLTSETYQAWFKLVPLEVYSTTAALKNETINFNIGLKCQMQTMIGEKPKSSFEKNKISLKQIDKIQPDFQASIVAISSYESASKIMIQNFAGKEFGSGSKKVTVKQVDIWHKDKKLIIALDLLGYVNGKIYLHGNPSYDKSKKEIYFDNLDYVLNTKGILSKTANWLLHGMILNKIKENCRYSIVPNLEEGKKNLAPYFKNYSPVKGIFVNGNLDRFDFDKIEITDSVIVAFIEATGRINVKVNGF